MPSPRSGSNPARARRLEIAAPEARRDSRPTGSGVRSPIRCFAHSPHRRFAVSPFRPLAHSPSRRRAAFHSTFTPIRPINSGLFMNYRIIGTTLPVLELQLNPDESVFAVSGELSWMNSAITMNTTTQFGGGGGLFGALKRMAGGGSLFMTDYSGEGGEGLFAFSTCGPGSILFLEIIPTQNYLIHRHGFLCATHGVELNVGFQQSLGAGIFGGDGFLLQKVSGTGHAWIELDGEVVTYDLKPGETLRVHPGHVGMFQESVNFQITRVPCIKNMPCGGDGIFLATLNVPGRVCMQVVP